MFPEVLCRFLDLTFQQNNRSIKPVNRSQKRGLYFPEAVSGLQMFPGWVPSFVEISVNAVWNVLLYTGMITESCPSDDAREYTTKYATIRTPNILPKGDI